jgi:hypothetical protein
MAKSHLALSEWTGFVAADSTMSDFKFQISNLTALLTRSEQI